MRHHPCKAEAGGATRPLDHFPVPFTTLYLDNNATTRPDDAVTGAVADAMRTRWANPSSIHRPGQEARHAVELARAEIAALINANPRHVTFTSGGTEAIDLAIRGVLAAAPAAGPRPRVVSTPTEHASVRDLLAALHKRGAIDLALLDIDRQGVVVTASIDRAIAPGTRLVSVHWANNETGAVQEIAAVAARCRAAGAIFHCDATQWVGKMPTDAGACGADLLTFSSHKWHGPKGVGVLWARPGVRLAPRLVGTQENGRRGGTENTSAIVGAGVAARLALQWVADPALREAQRALRDRFERAVLSAVPEARVNGPTDPSCRLWNTANIAFPRLEAEALLMAFSERGLCASAGAACSSGSLDPSPVLLAMGVPPELAHGSVRFSLSRESTADEIDRAAAVVTEGVQRVGSSMTG